MNNKIHEHFFKQNIYFTNKYISQPDIKRSDFTLFNKYKMNYSNKNEKVADNIETYEQSESVSNTQFATETIKDIDEESINIKEYINLFNICLDEIIIKKMVNYKDFYFNKKLIEKIYNKNIIEFIRLYHDEGIEKGLIINKKQINKFYKCEFEDNYVNHKNIKYNYCDFINNFFNEKNFDELFENVLIKKITNISNYNVKTIFLIHIGDLEKGNYILKKINKLENILILISTIIDIDLSLLNKNYIIYKTKNLGNDLIGSIKIYNDYKDIIHNQFIVKLQTKSDDKIFYELTDYLINNHNEIINIMEKNNFYKVCTKNKCVSIKDNTYYYNVVNDSFCRKILMQKDNNLMQKEIPDDFDAKTYQEYHNDLNNLNEQQLINHYINHGKYENRVYKKNDNYFCAMSFFIIEKKKLNENLDKLFFLLKPSLINCFYYDNLMFLNNSPVHAIERIVSEYNIKLIIETNTNKKIAINIAVHIDSDFSDRDLTILENNLFYLTNSNIDIFIYYTGKINVKFIKKYPNITFVVSNNNNLDFGKHFHFYDNEINNYDNFILLNDSIIIERFKDFIDFVNFNNNDLIGYIESNQNVNHYQSWCYYMNKKTFQILYNNFKNKKAHFIELNFPRLIENKICYYPCLKNFKGNIFFHYNVFKIYNNNGFNIYKKKQIYLLISEELSKLTNVHDLLNRSFKNIPNDFNHETYLKYNQDLLHFSNEQLENHFINYGIYEFRKYTDKNVIFINPQIKKMIKNKKLLEY
jgi:hypothetical protein